MIFSVVLNPKSINEKYFESNVRICADGAGNERKTLNPDFIIGDMDSFHALSSFDSVANNKYEGKTWTLGNLKVISNPCQNTTDFQKCLNFIKEEYNNVDEIRIFGGLDGRFDHTLSILHTLQQYHFDCKVTLFDTRNIIMILSSGQHYLDYETYKDYSVGLVSFEENRIQTFGFQWDIDDIIYFGHFISTSNRLTQNAKISCEKVCFLILSE
eukprot:NODE_153_length_15389_cov_1.201439.p8 type:complete len:213 gc:universal NODE_153_length_15389_cov_1.201439:7076-6438(-)